MNIPRLENWSVIVRGDGYTPPEDSPAPCVAGEVYGHPLHRDGKALVTSSVVSVDEETQVFTTFSGSVYQLGTPEPEYAEYCKEIGKEAKLRTIEK